MPPKGANSKKEAGRSRKEENESKKKEVVAATKEKKVAGEWEDGAKSTKKKEDQEDKKRADAARKAEAARLLAEEEAANAISKPKVKAVPNKGKASAAAKKPAGPGAIAAGGGLGPVIPDGADAGGASGGDVKAEDVVDQVTESFSATGIDDALDLLAVVTAKTDKASVGQQAAGLEKHPERRFKAAFDVYIEQELPELRKDHPGLRLQQYRDILYKQYQKHPDNPFNQVLVSYDATKEDKVDALKKQKASVEDRLREKLP